MSRFVSSGTNEEPTERDEAWVKAQQQIESARQEKAKSQQDSGKSLYETLQANKAAKQEAFEEATRLRNQFRSLDEDEVEFLESVNESTRSKEAEVKRETREQLEAFRRQQEEAEKSASQDPLDQFSDSVLETWAVGPRKRKKPREKESSLKALRRTSTAEDKATPSAPGESAVQSHDREAKPLASALSAGKDISTPTDEKQSNAVSATAQKPPLLGLAAYSSDDDD